MNISQQSIPALCSLLTAQQAWDCRGTATSTGFVLELFRPSTSLGRETCSRYLLLPAENTWTHQTRALLYALALVYCFIGLGTITAVYMEAMENIVKQTRQVFVRDALTGVAEIKHEKIWNSTVADITLLALGTSSPQISLAIIDSIQHLGELSIDGVGPGTLVGSAAFNLFPTLAVCVLVPKNGALRRIEKMSVFIVELSWSIWAYIWLFFILKVSSPNKITLLEALLTMLQFPLLILHAYGEDRGWLYISVSFWFEKVATWIQAWPVHGINSDQKPSDDDADYPSSYGGNGHSMSELGVVTSEQLQLSAWRNYQADVFLDAQFQPLGEAQADSPAILFLHQDPILTLEDKGNHFLLRNRWKAQLYHAMTVRVNRDENGNEVLPTMAVLLKHVSATMS